MKKIYKSDGNKTVLIMEFDKEDSQEEYLHIAKSLKSGEYEVGYVAIHKPWYSSESRWVYYILRDEYDGRGLNGGAVDLGLKKIEVDKDTIEPYRQTAVIKVEQSKAHDILIVKDINNQDDKNNIILQIGVSDKIPFNLWNK